MTNKERQASLDKKKWLESEQKRMDLSGVRGYCNACTHAHNLKCNATQEKREQECLCAKAYNRWERILRRKNYGNTNN